MWTFMLLCVLGLSTSQATGKDNSTQMYYAKLTIEEGAIKNITNILGPFVSDPRLRVDDLRMTTVCRGVGGTTACSCKPNYRWSDEVCGANHECCSAGKCSFPAHSADMCISNSTVTINGSLTLNGLEYHDCLAEKTSSSFQQCHGDLLKQMKTEYSTLRGFKSLIINKYSAGSIIVDFTLTIASNIKTQLLQRNSESLARALQASLVLSSSGVIIISRPPSPVCYHSQHNLICTSEDGLNMTPVWQLDKTGRVFNITNGTESVVHSGGAGTTLTLKNISELWEGEYTCSFNQRSDVFAVLHKASTPLDVALLPHIANSSAPAFPRCSERSGLVNIRVKCEIARSSERYNVTWTKEDITSKIKPLIISGASNDTEIYVADTVIGCDPSLKPAITCTFSNRCNQERSAKININVIYEGDRYCPAEGEWEDTKAGFSAEIRCEKATGFRRRKCKDGTPQAKFEHEESSCVNKDLDRTLHSAKIADIGLGTLDQNAGDVFSRLKDATNNTASINTLPNMDTSVEILVSLSGKLRHIDNESVVDDLLDSSSNLLEESLGRTWAASTNSQDLSLAEKYLSSVEHLFEVTNLTVASKKANVALQTTCCTGASQCTNSVFGANVSLKSSDPGMVKSAGFKQLQTYLPLRGEQYEPNSIVVSTTTERRLLGKFEVTIDFPLLKPRPRNVKLSCVSWDNSTRQWSGYGCEWGGPDNEGRCRCNHFSSFAILMSRFELDIRGLAEITVVGLSASVASLVLSLLIELIVWSAVVKSNTSYLRHTAQVNISICLLVADICFLASSEPKRISKIWCQTFVVVKHFCYLAMFFWMLCLSCILLHQAMFLFHKVSKKSYLRFSLVLGYVCPLLIVAITFIANRGGADGLYFSSHTCWLVYDGLLEGSIHTFLIPVGIIVFVNVFAMLVVIMKLLDHPKNADKSCEKDIKAAKTVIRSVLLLTPIFGVTWIFGFAVTFLDLTSGYAAYAVNYIFTLLNAFQGFFILLTICLADKLVRDALLTHIKRKVPASLMDGSRKTDPALKK